MNNPSSNARVIGFVLQFLVNAVLVFNDRLDVQLVSARKLSSLKFSSGVYHGWLKKYCCNHLRAEHASVPRVDLVSQQPQLVQAQSRAASVR